MRRILPAGSVLLLLAVVAASCAEGETLDPDAISQGGHGGKSARGGSGGTSNDSPGGSSSAGSSVDDGMTGGGSGTGISGSGGASAMGGGGNGVSGGGGASTGGAGGTGGTGGGAISDGGAKDATVPMSCDAGSSCVQCAEQKCPSMACAKCEDQNHVKCATACEAMLACVIQHFPCGGANDGICFNQCNQIINAQPGGSPPRDWTNALIACGCN